ncbi:MAG: AAA family ATPase [Lachnospiraceae bacterium]|nr:AAA family ATPase [Ruminococcus sp.]MCM1276156.1 AAA family ATPase [Lachnospiraceae bacterium]
MDGAVSVITELIGQREKPLIVGIDGRCAAGKTTLAERLRERIGCNVIHADSFFPRPEQRSSERIVNLDCERLVEEVMLPLKSGKAFSYRVFDCKEMQFAEEIHVEPRDTAIIEGSYSLCPALWDFYGLRIFLTVDHEEQLRRLERRNAAALPAFRERWIPLEEKYFAAMKTAERCDRIFDMQ